MKTIHFFTLSSITVIIIILYFIGQDLKYCKSQIIETQNTLLETISLMKNQSELNDKMFEASETIVDIIEHYHPK